MLGGVEPHLMVTDPPYGVNYDPAWRNEAGTAVNGSLQRITSGCVINRIKSRAVGKVENDDRADWSEAWTLFPGVVAYVWHAGIKASAVQISLEGCGFGVRAQIIWAKNNFAISRGHYHAKHERAGTRASANVVSPACVRAIIPLTRRRVINQAVRRFGPCGQMPGC